MNQIKSEVDFLQKQLEDFNSKEDVVYKIDPETGEKIRDLTYGLTINMDDIEKAKADIDELKL